MVERDTDPCRHRRPYDSELLGVKLPNSGNAHLDRSGRPVDAGYDIRHGVGFAPPLCRPLRESLQILVYSGVYAAECRQDVVAKPIS